ncbi:MAG: DUF1553 domain-containing protein [Planctomycetes bacterium]|nr:DUF1553 domain-containing protein [Planctomycetota bacterium]
MNQRTNRATRTHLALLCLACIPCRVAADDKPAGTLRTLNAHPTVVRLSASNDVQRVVVVVTEESGLTRDVTDLAGFAFSPEGIVEHVGGGLLVPRQAGAAVLTIAHDGLRAEVKIVAANTERSISFRNDVEPVLMKAGCNSGACHGNARGQEGFRLSLFGFDPQMDYINLTRQASGRRLNVAEPDSSLMFLKATAQVGHGGGERFTKDNPLFAVVDRWVRAGLPNDPPDVPTLTGLSILPRACVLASGGATQQTVVRATYSDGTERDVSALALFSTLNEASAVIDSNGRVTAKDPGEAFVMARFGTFAVVAQIVVVADQPFEWPQNVRPFNYIDEAVHAKLRKMRVRPSAVASDEVFLRRAYLDILGLLPTPAETEHFLRDAAAGKRARLIDELLQRPEFPEVWAMKWGEMLRIESSKLGVKGVELYSSWIRDAIFRDVPLDRIVRDLLTAEGGSFHNPPANFFLVETSPTTMAENVAQVFMGVRVQCAQCHNHPFERWTQDDYYSFAAFFAQIGRKRSEDPRETIVYNSGGGEVKHLRTGQNARPKFLGGEVPDIPGGQDRRKVFADWLTARDNPWFAQCFVNRVWAHFFGRGIVDPPDDVRVSNPPSHPELLERLGQKLVESGYDIRALVRDICNSRTYQLSTRVNETNARDTRNLSHATIRRLSAEQLLDAICAVTQVREKFAGLPLGARAMQVADAKTGSYFLGTFGRPPRQTACTCERRDEPTLSQALHLINGPTVWEKIKSPNGRLERLLEAGSQPDVIVNELYLAALARGPTAAERAAAATHIAASKDARTGLQDLFWAVLNSHEFVFNH